MCKTSALTSTTNINSGSYEIFYFQNKKIPTKKKGLLKNERLRETFFATTKLKILKKCMKVFGNCSREHKYATNTQFKQFYKVRT